MNQEIQKIVEASLIKSIEIILGRVPSSKELADNVKYSFQDLPEEIILFAWKGLVILKVHRPVAVGDGYSGLLEEIDLSNWGKYPPNDPTQAGEGWKNIT